MSLNPDVSASSVTMVKSKSQQKITEVVLVLLTHHKLHYNVQKYEEEIHTLQEDFDYYEEYFTCMSKKTLL